MVTEQAQSGFNRLLDKSIQTCLTGDEPSCQIDVIPASSVEGRKMAVITMSSYQFRVLLLVHFTLNNAVIQHFGAKGHLPDEQRDHATILDLILESCNMCCGAISRELHGFYPHIGMSTPSLLEGDSRGFVEGLHTGYMRHVRITMLNGATMYASLVVCEQITLDFQLPDTQVEEDVAGELEFF